MHRKVMVACVCVAALLTFARLAGSGRASDSIDIGRQAPVPALAQIAGLPAAPAEAAAGTQASPTAAGPGSSATNRNRNVPATRAPIGLDLLAGFSAAGARATATAAAASPAPALKAAEVAPRATPAPAADTQELLHKAPAAGAAVTNTSSSADAAPAEASAALNGVPLDSIVVLSPGALDHVRQVYALGQARGRNPRAFSKVGDSTMAFPPLLAVFDNAGGYRLGPYAYLSSTIERFAGSLSRESAAVKKGMHTWTEFDPSWVNSDRCQSGEGPLACELRLNNPSFVFIRLGANDYDEPKVFREELLKILDYCLVRGVVPVLGTKPDRLEGPENTINQIVYQLAADYDLPLWDYDRIASTVPGKGLMSDGAHFLNGGSRDYSSQASFKTADSLEDLTALMMLDALGRALK